MNFLFNNSAYGEYIKKNNKSKENRTSTIKSNFSTNKNFNNIKRTNYNTSIKNSINAYNSNENANKKLLLKSNDTNNTTKDNCFLLKNNTVSNFGSIENKKYYTTTNYTNILNKNDNNSNCKLKAVLEAEEALKSIFDLFTFNKKRFNDEGTNSFRQDIIKKINLNNLKESSNYYNNFFSNNLSKQKQNEVSKIIKHSYLQENKTADIIENRCFKCHIEFYFKFFNDLFSSKIKCQLCKYFFCKNCCNNQINGSYWKNPDIIYYLCNYCSELYKKVDQYIVLTNNNKKITNFDYYISTYDQDIPESMKILEYFTVDNVEYEEKLQNLYDFIVEKVLTSVFEENNIYLSWYQKIANCILDVIYYTQPSFRDLNDTLDINDYIILKSIVKKEKNILFDNLININRSSNNLMQYKAKKIKNYNKSINKANYCNNHYNNQNSDDEDECIKEEYIYQDLSSEDDQLYINKINGYCFVKNINIKNIPKAIKNPKILIFDCSLEYSRNLDLTISCAKGFIEMEDNYYFNLVKKIKSKKPDIIVTQGKVPLKLKNLILNSVNLKKDIQISDRYNNYETSKIDDFQNVNYDFNSNKSKVKIKHNTHNDIKDKYNNNIFFLTNVNSNCLKNLARFTKTIVLPSADFLDEEIVLGSCKFFSVEKTNSFSSDRNNINNYTIENTYLMIFSGCDPLLGSTLIFSSSNLENLETVEKIVYILLLTIRNLYLRKFLLFFFNCDFMMNDSLKKIIDNKKENNKISYNRNKTINKDCYNDNYIFDIEEELSNSLIKQENNNNDNINDNIIYKMHSKDTLNNKNYEYRNNYNNYLKENYGSFYDIYSTNNNKKREKFFTGICKESKLNIMNSLLNANNINPVNNTINNIKENNSNTCDIKKSNKIFNSNKLREGSLNACATNNISTCSNKYIRNLNESNNKTNISNSKLLNYNSINYNYNTIYNDSPDNDTYLNHNISKEIKRSKTNCIFTLAYIPSLECSQSVIKIKSNLKKFEIENISNAIGFFNYINQLEIKQKNTLFKGFDTNILSEENRVLNITKLVIVLGQEQLNNISFESSEDRNLEEKNRIMSNFYSNYSGFSPNIKSKNKNKINLNSNTTSEFKIKTIEKTNNNNGFNANSYFYNDIANNNNSIYNENNLATVTFRDKQNTKTNIDNISLLKRRSISNNVYKYTTNLINNNNKNIKNNLNKTVINKKSKQSYYQNLSENQVLKVVKTTCKEPENLKLTYYSNNMIKDKPLGKLIIDLINDKNYKCNYCKRIQENHVYYLYKKLGRIKISFISKDNLSNNDIDWKFYNNHLRVENNILPENYNTFNNNANNTNNNVYNKLSYDNKSKIYNKQFEYYINKNNNEIKKFNFNSNYANYIHSYRKLSVESIKSKDLLNNYKKYRKFLSEDHNKYFEDIFSYGLCRHICKSICKINENNNNNNISFKLQDKKECFVCYNKIVTPIIKLPREIFNLSSAQFFKFYLFESNINNRDCNLNKANFDKLFSGFSYNEDQELESNKIYNDYCNHKTNVDIDRIFFTTKGALRFQYQKIHLYMIEACLLRESLNPMHYQALSQYFISNCKNLVSEITCQMKINIMKMYKDTYNYILFFNNLSKLSNNNNNNNNNNINLNLITFIHIIKSTINFDDVLLILEKILCLIDRSYIRANEIDKFFNFAVSNSNRFEDYIKFFLFKRKICFRIVQNQIRSVATINLLNLFEDISYVIDYTIKQILFVNNSVLINNDIVITPKSLNLDLSNKTNTVSNINNITIAKNTSNNIDITDNEVLLPNSFSNKLLKNDVGLNSHNNLLIKDSFNNAIPISTNINNQNKINNLSLYNEDNYVTNIKINNNLLENNESNSCYININNSISYQEILNSIDCLDEYHKISTAEVHRDDLSSIIAYCLTSDKYREFINQTTRDKVKLIELKVERQMEHPMFTTNRDKDNINNNNNNNLSNATINNSNINININQENLMNKLNRDATINKNYNNKTNNENYHQQHEEYTVYNNKRLTNAYNEDNQTVFPKFNPNCYVKPGEDWNVSSLCYDSSKNYYYIGNVNLDNIQINNQLETEIISDNNNHFCMSISNINLLNRIKTWSADLEMPSLDKKANAYINNLNTNKVTNVNELNNTLKSSNLNTEKQITKNELNEKKKDVLNNNAIQGNNNLLLNSHYSNDIVACDVCNINNIDNICQCIKTNNAYNNLGISKHLSNNAINSNFSRSNSAINNINVPFSNITSNANLNSGSLININANFSNLPTPEIAPKVNGVKVNTQSSISSVNNNNIINNRGSDSTPMNICFSNNIISQDKIIDNKNITNTCFNNRLILPMIDINKDFKLLEESNKAISNIKKELFNNIEKCITYIGKEKEGNLLNNLIANNLNTNYNNKKNYNNNNTNNNSTDILKAIKLQNSTIVANNNTTISNVKHSLSNNLNNLTPPNNLTSGGSISMTNLNINSADENNINLTTNISNSFNNPLLNNNSISHFHKYIGSEEVSIPLDIEIICYFPRQFEALRIAYCSSYENFILSVAYSFQWDNVTGGKSHSKFYKCHDDRYILKSISKREFKMFLESANQYFHHNAKYLFHKMPSALAKILGAYRIRKSGSDNDKHYIFLMENMFFAKSTLESNNNLKLIKNNLINNNNMKNKYQCQMNLIDIENIKRDRSISNMNIGFNYYNTNNMFTNNISNINNFSSNNNINSNSNIFNNFNFNFNYNYNKKKIKAYDLKGSSANRYISVVNQKEGHVLLDTNFKEDFKGEPLALEKGSFNLLLSAINNDTLLLSKMAVVDYSLLLIIDDISQEFEDKSDYFNIKTIRVGIIDYIRKYTWDKQLENLGKTIIHRKAPTIINPGSYRERFIEAMTNYFIGI